ncbi:helix-turn-helix transcriptional regulator [Fusibacter bizertensis]
MEETIKKCKQYIEKHIEDELSVELIAKIMGYSKHHFSRAFSNQVGVTLRDYIIDERLVRATIDIIKGERILDVAVKYRYETHSGFSKAFKRKFAYSPNLLTAMNITEKSFNSEGGTTMTHEQVYNELVQTINDSASVEHMNLLERAYKFAIKANAGKKRYSGEDYVTHPLSVAKLLAEMEAPIETVILGILHDCNEHDSCISIDEIRNEFGEAYYYKVKRINALNMSANLLNEVDIETEEDLVMVKLADRLHNMKTLKFLDQTRWKIKAKETMEIFSLLAEKIGVIEMKVKLDSLSIAISQA